MFKLKKIQFLKDAFKLKDIQYRLTNIKKTHLYVGTSVNRILLPERERPFPSHIRYQSSLKGDNVESNQNKSVNIDQKEPTRVDKLKKAVKEYGSTVIVFHVGISLLSLGTCYLMVSSGLNMLVVFETLGLQDWASNSALAANAGTFAVAYAVHKVFAPVRITITLGSVPFIVRYLRKVGFLKKV